MPTKDIPSDQVLDRLLEFSLVLNIEKVQTNFYSYIVCFIENETWTLKLETVAKTKSEQSLSGDCNREDKHIAEVRTVTKSH